jgi:hypothetical protein
MLSAFDPQFILYGQVRRRFVEGAEPDLDFSAFGGAFEQPRAADWAKVPVVEVLRVANGVEVIGRIDSEGRKDAPCLQAAGSAMTDPDPLRLAPYPVANGAAGTSSVSLLHCHLRRHLELKPR